MTGEETIRDLLVPDRNTRAAIQGFLTRHHSLGIRPVKADVHVHPERDCGCRTAGVEYFRPFSNQYHYALLMFDYEGCGIVSTCPGLLEQQIEMEIEKAKDEVTENHLLCRVARSYSKRVNDWFEGKETLSFESAAAVREGVDLDEAFEVIRWYQYFICAKIMWAVRGAMEDREEPCDEFPSDSDGSAKIALIAIDRSIAAWAVVHTYCGEDALDIIALLDHLRQAVEKTYPKARSFIRPGFDSVDLNK